MFSLLSGIELDLVGTTLLVKELLAVFHVFVQHIVAAVAVVALERAEVISEDRLSVSSLVHWFPGVFEVHVPKRWAPDCALVDTVVQSCSVRVSAFYHHLCCSLF